MRSKMTYNMKLVIDGETGEIYQATCECPAGRGPTGSCKHVVTVLLALVKFAKEGVLQVQLSCTEKLQTFKRPTRAHQGSPVHAEDLGKSYDFEHDPRPKRYRNWSGRMDHIYNATTNFCAQSGLDITMRYAYLNKADLQAADIHHDYLKAPLVET